MSAGFKAGSNEAGVQSVFSGTYNGAKWDSCAPNVATYTTTSTSASVKATLSVTRLSNNDTAQGPIMLKLKAAGGVWELDNIVVLSQS
jgi:hypothetical protein